MRVAGNEEFLGGPLVPAFRAPEEEPGQKRIRVTC